MLISLCTIFATLGPVGYLIGPGTIATLLTVPLVYWLRMNFDSFQYGVLIALFMVAALVIVSWALTRFKRSEDPSEIVLDEVIGCLITFFNVPLSTSSLIVGVIVFRFFDILKVGGVHYAERLTGAWGVLLDDVVAGCISCLILHLIF